MPLLLVDSAFPKISRKPWAGLARQVMRQRLGRGNGAASCALAASKA